MFIVAGGIPQPLGLAQSHEKYMFTESLTKEICYCVAFT